MSRLNKIAFDIDGTCVDVMEYVQNRLLKVTGINTLESDKYEILKEFDIKPELFWKFLIDAYKRWDRTIIYAGISDLMEAIYSRSGEYIQFVTGRNAAYSAETHKLVKRFCKKVPFQIAFVNGVNAKKQKFIVDHYTFFYEDRRRTAIELANENIIVFMPERRYNSIENIDKHLAIRRPMSPFDLLNLIPSLCEEKS